MRIGWADRRWAAWMALSSLATVAYGIVPNASIAAAVVQFVVGLTAFVMMIAGIRRHRPVDAAGWYIFAAGQLLWVAGDVVYQIDTHILHIDVYPSFADVLYLAGYPLFFLGVLRLGRSRFRRDRAGLLDALILATGVGLVLWVFAIEPLVVTNGTAWIALPFILGIPVSDVLLLAVAVSLLTTAGRRTASLNLMIAGLALLIVTDTAYSYLTTTGTYDGGVIDCGWLFAYVLWTGAMLHPSVARSAPAAAGGPLRVSRGRLALLAAGTLLVPAVLLIQGVRHDLESTWLAVAVCAVVLFGLVLTRMSGFVAQVQSQSRQLEDLAMRDELTGLANRRQFEQRIALAAGGPAQVLVLDLTGFKQVNDRFGHAAGDQLLAGVAARLASRMRDGDLVARMGGDEFAVLVPDATAAEGEAVAERLAAALRTPIMAGEHELLVGASFGVAGADGTADADELLRRADVAMYAAKTSGDRIRRYAEVLDVRAGEESRLGAELRTALDSGQFRLVYQPIVSLPDGGVVSVEALVRWEHPGRGVVRPADFIPVAEQNGLIVELGAWILHTACAQAATWRAELGDAAPERMSVNVSARQLAEPGFCELVASVLARTGLPAHRLVVEVTETAVFGGGQAVLSVQRLHELGVKIALDDFGTGHSSLGLLQTVPVDMLKVDKSFVDNITMAGRHAVIATALIQVSHGLGLAAVAEGVETAEQAAELYRLGYRLAQGYHFGRPAATLPGDRRTVAA